ncbi:transporter substrate-binding domain-containing protein [Fusobacteria bacterium ZRK30]|nr:transporter substrate-binding domain-containing protein [Fusobacteria bacterium ZRK30]
MNKYIIFLIIFFLGTNLYSKSEIDLSKISLSEKEMTFLKKIEDKKIDVFVENSDNFLFFYDLEKNQRGLYPKIIQEMNNIFNLNLNIIPKEIFELSKLKERGDGAIIFDMLEKKDLHNYYVFSKSIYNFNTAVIGQQEIKKILDLKDKKIIFLKGDKLYDDFIEKYGYLNITPIFVKDRKQAFKKLNQNESLLYIGEIEKNSNFIGLNNTVKLSILLTDINSDLKFAIKKEYSPLKDIFNKLIDLYSDEDRSQLIGKYLLQYKKNSIYFDSEEKEFLSRLSKLQLVLLKDDNYYPYYSRDSKGNLKGLSIDYISSIKNILNENIDIEYIVKEDKIYEDSHTDKDFILPLLIRTPEREKKFLFPEPYYSFNLSVYNRQSGGFIDDISDLENSTIAVIKGAYYISYLKGHLNNATYIDTPSLTQSLKLLREGKVDFLVGDMKTIENHLAGIKINDIKIAGVTDKVYDVSFAVSKDNPQLYNVLNKVFSKLHIENKFLMRKWNANYSSFTSDYKVSIFILVISLGILSITLVSYRNVKNRKIALQKITLSLVTTLENANYYNDEDTGNHIRRVNEYSRLIAEKLRCHKNFIKDIGFYASLHDIGKIGVHDGILKKKDKLSEEEFKSMKEHVKIGYNLIKDANLPSMVENIALYHHEKWNGMGYLEGLKGKEIPLEARIVALSDVYDALRQKRSYKDGFTHEKSMKIISKESGKHFDPEIVNIFIKHNDKFNLIFESNREQIK